MKRLLVTGASGKVAQLLAPFLSVQPDLHVRWQSRRSKQLHADWVCCDPLRDWSQFLTACRGCDAVIHLGGVTPAAKAPDFSVNVRLSQAVMRAAQEAEVPVMLAASTAAVYGPSLQPLPETVPAQPTTAYGQSKLESELALTQAVKGPTRLRIMRIGNVLGADALMKGQPRPTWLHQFEDGCTPVRSYIAPVSLARVILALVTAKNVPSVLNIAAPKPIEMSELLQAARLRWLPVQAPAEVPKRVAMDVTRMMKTVDWQEEPESPAELAAQWQAQQLPRFVA